MKNVVILCLIAIFTVACNQTDKKQNDESEIETESIAMATEYSSIGDEISSEDVMTTEEIAEKYKSMKPGDTIAITFKSKVNAVCQNKGCWMKMDMGDAESMVKFKDYGFFMPKDLAGAEVIVGGVAFVEEMSVEDQRHFAEDAGKSKEEIAAITEPKRTLSFISNGVLIPEDYQNQ
ncbi:DUF4920 domain-containing protein [Constantimarinum furrinae]|uniref:DUF4920 domain-containing protein n=1 Tax=Constantimarinum furrinae TaxID=2562285 RepID=A0A7G8PR03_9FLAO|nr:DUF4920 domain-containing protein [Constantimarinum furrinae]QNJ96769.1 hypothetical protein ALE3EI_0179 [Constantimarinum furrinae]